MLEGIRYFARAASSAKAMSPETAWLAPPSHSLSIHALVGSAFDRFSLIFEKKRVTLKTPRRRAVKNFAGLSTATFSPQSDADALPMTFDTLLITAKAIRNLGNL